MKKPKIGDIVLVPVPFCQEYDGDRARCQIIDSYDYGTFRTFEVQFPDSKSQEIPEDQLERR